MDVLEGLGGYEVASQGSGLELGSTTWAGVGWVKAEAEHVQRPWGSRPIAGVERAGYGVRLRGWG